HELLDVDLLGIERVVDGAGQLADALLDLARRQGGIAEDDAATGERRIAWRPGTGRPDRVDADPDAPAESLEHLRVGDTLGQVPQKVQAGSLAADIGLAEMATERGHGGVPAFPVACPDAGDMGGIA